MYVQFMSGVYGVENDSNKAANLDQYWAASNVSRRKISFLRIDFNKMIV